MNVVDVNALHEGVALRLRRFMNTREMNVRHRCPINRSAKLPGAADSDPEMKSVWLSQGTIESAKVVITAAAQKLIVILNAVLNSVTSTKPSTPP